MPKKSKTPPAPERVQIAPVEDFDDAWARASNRVELLLGLAEAKQSEGGEESNFWGGVALTVGEMRNDVEQMRNGERDLSDRLFAIDHPEDARALDRLARLSVRRARKGGAK